MFKRYLWKLCWLAFALVKRGESMKKTYLVVIVLFFISTKVYTLLHNNIFFCRNSPECDLSHVLPDYREQISGTPLKYTLINTAPLAQVVVRHYELLSQHWSPDDMVTPAQWRHNVDIYIPETAKEHHALVLGFNAAEMGMIFSAFFIGYALFNFIGGWASDKVGPKTVFLIAALLWSVFCGLTGLVTGLWTMLIVRVLFGMAEGPVSAAGNKIINNWISRKESATAIGIFSAGSPLGGAVSGPIVGLLALSLGWRPAFGIIFLFGLVWVLLWYFIVSDKPTMSKRLAPEERIDFENHEDVILSDDGRATPSLGYYMKQPMVWATTLAFFSYNYILFFFLTWFPSYLNHSLHLDIKEISIATVIPWVIGAIGMVLGGVCSDVIYRITGNALLSRRLILGVCLAGAAVCVAVSGTVSTIGSAITLMSVSLFLLYLTGPIYWAVIQDVVHKDKVGSVGGAMHGLANISGIIGPLVTGFIVQFSGKYDYAFYLAGAIAIVSSLLVFVFVKSKGFKANESQSCVH